MLNPASVPFFLKLAPRLETSGARLCLPAAAPGDPGLLIPASHGEEPVCLDMSVALRPLTALQDEGNWSEAEHSALDRLLKDLGAHPGLWIASRCLAYNLLSGGWARGIRKDALQLRVKARFIDDGIEKMIEEKGALAWEPWAVAKPSQAQAGTPDPYEEKAAAIAPLARVIHAVLSGKAFFTLVEVRAFFTLAEDSPWWRRNRHHSADYIAKALRTFDRFHSGGLPDKVFPVEPDGLQDRRPFPVRAPQEQFLGILQRGMTAPASLSDAERTYLVGVFLRGQAAGRARSNSSCVSRETFGAVPGRRAPKEVSPYLFFPMNDTFSPTPPPTVPPVSVPVPGFAQPPEITRLIEPIERNLVERLEYSYQVQAEVFGKVRARVLDGTSACPHPELEQLHRLHELHTHLLDTYGDVSKIGSRLRLLGQIDPTAGWNSEDIPF
jgi:hypothetical protein